MEPRFQRLEEIPDRLSEAQQAGAMSDVVWYRCRCDSREYSVLISRDDIMFGKGVPDWRWHISVAGQDDVPKWRHFVAIVQALRPGVMFALPLPPRSMWFNVHPYTLHVQEIKDDALIEKLREEADVAHALGLSTPS